MPTARQYLSSAIEEHKEELVERICNKLQKFSQSHYETLAYEHHQEREELFLNVILQTLQDDQSESLPKYIQELVQQRSNEGYTLKEIEEAFDIVEDTLWEVLTKYCPLEQSLIEVLSIVKKLFHAAKNSFAQLFFQDALNTQKQFENVRRKFIEYRNERHEE